MIIILAFLSILLILVIVGLSQSVCGEKKNNIIMGGGKKKKKKIRKKKKKAKKKAKKKSKKGSNSSAPSSGSFTSNNNEEMSDNEFNSGLAYVLYSFLKYELHIFSESIERVSISSYQFLDELYKSISITTLFDLKLFFKEIILYVLNFYKDFPTTINNYIKQYSLGDKELICLNYFEYLCNDLKTQIEEITNPNDKIYDKQLLHKLNSKFKKYSEFEEYIKKNDDIFTSFLDKIDNNSMSTELNRKISMYRFEIDDIKKILYFVNNKDEILSLLKSVSGDIKISETITNPFNNLRLKYEGMKIKLSVEKNISEIYEIYNSNKHYFDIDQIKKLNRIT
jgi:hypothetical protein